MNMYIILYHENDHVDLARFQFNVFIMTEKCIGYIDSNGKIYIYPLGKDSVCI